MASWALLGSLAKWCEIPDSLLERRGHLLNEDLETHLKQDSLTSALLALAVAKVDQKKCHQHSGLPHSPQTESKFPQSWKILLGCKPLKWTFLAVQSAVQSTNRLQTSKPSLHRTFSKKSMNREIRSQPSSQTHIKHTSLSSYSHSNHRATWTLSGNWTTFSTTRL